MSVPDGTEAAWWRHVLYGLAGQTFEAQSALDKFEAAMEARTLREAAEKIRADPPPADLDGRFGPYINAWLDGQSEAADLIDPDKEG